MGSAWNQLGVDIEGEAAGDQFCYSVSLSADGQTVAIGAPYAGSKVGHVCIYGWNGSSWNKLGANIDGDVARQLGYSVSLSADGQTVAIGAPSVEYGNSISSQVQIYRWNGSSWNKLGANIDGEANLVRAGWDQTGLVSLAGC